MSNLWLIGDEFLMDAYHALQKLQTEARSARRAEPYVYDYYNISCFTTSPNSAVRNIMSRFVNCLVKALNDAKELPRIILVIPDWDILKAIDHETFGIKLLLDDSLNWIVSKMNKAIESKKDNMRRRKPGSVLPAQPKVIWVQMFNRITMRSQLMAHRSKFNTVLEKHLAIHMNHYIMNINSAMQDTTFFDSKNRINSYGRAQFWLEIDQQIELFDKHKLSLRPASYDNNNVNNKRMNDNKGNSQPKYRKPSATVSSANGRNYDTNDQHSHREHRY